MKLERRNGLFGVSEVKHESTKALALLICAVGFVLSYGSRAAAQQRTFYLDRVQVSGAPDDGLVAWRPYFYEKTRFYAAGTLGYTLNPLRSGTVTDNSSVAQRIENPVRHQIITHLHAGAEVSGRYGFSLTLPIMFFQEGGDDPRAEGVGEGLQRTPLTIHDLRLDGRVKVYESDDRDLRLGLGLAIWLPTGNSFAFAGDNEVTWMPYGNGEYDFGDFMVSGLIGPHLRPDRSIQGSNGALSVGSELRWGGTVFVPLRGDEFRLGGSLWGTIGLGPSGTRNIDVEWLGEIRTHIDPDKKIYVSGGGGTRLANGYGSPDIRLLGQIGTYALLSDLEPDTRTEVRPRRAPTVAMYDKDTDGDGFPDDIDLCPNVKEDGQPPDPDDGCPGVRDRDKDGIPDDEDKCPDEPEDKDGIQDYDGCPETDADADGIPDTEDACPTKKGVENKADPKKNGCPKRDKIVETESGIQLLEPIQFETGLATIKPVSFPMLDEVVDVLESRPNVRMAIHGHTDSVGTHAMNMQLSKNRAAAVLRYLVGKGIPANRLESDGYGPDQPVAPNDTPEGRAKNRRVEFKVIE